MNKLSNISANMPDTPQMPVLFIGHGSPTNALEDNEFTRGWHDMAKELPVPQSILCISAHWQTRGTQVTAMKKPRTIHDFGGFAQELYEIYYPASGNPVLALDVKEIITKTGLSLDQDWGLDHGCWVPLIKMYPDARIPVIQLSIDYLSGAVYHYEMAKELKSLRRKGVLIIGSGNMVHNLRLISVNDFSNINQGYGYEWAYEMNDIFKSKILKHDHKALIDYESLSKSAMLAIPTPEHYFPLLYILALQEDNESAVFFNDKAVAGSLTMTSVLIS
ncbi:MAG: 4,5-DOPA dioxygenase extradiol [Bacteroidia bacterium]|nr:4,5-DOPA dioxygenase extradiol [Bacteroidia bacterium]